MIKREREVEVEEKKENASNFRLGILFSFSLEALLKLSRSLTSTRARRIKATSDSEG